MGFDGFTVRSEKAVWKVFWFPVLRNNASVIVLKSNFPKETVVSFLRIET